MATHQPTKKCFTKFSFTSRAIVEHEYFFALLSNPSFKTKESLYVKSVVDIRIFRWSALSIKWPETKSMILICWFDVRSSFRINQMQGLWNFLFVVLFVVCFVVADPSFDDLNQYRAMSFSAYCSNASEQLQQWTCYWCDSSQSVTVQNIWSTDDNLFGYIATTEDSIWIAFRGTVESSFINWVTGSFPEFKKKLK